MWPGDTDFHIWKEKNSLQKTSRSSQNTQDSYKRNMSLTQLYFYKMLSLIGNILRSILKSFWTCSIWLKCFTVSWEIEKLLFTFLNMSVYVHSCTWDGVLCGKAHCRRGWMMKCRSHQGFSSNPCVHNKTRLYTARVSEGLLLIPLLYSV